MRLLPFPIYKNKQDIRIKIIIGDIELEPSNINCQAEQSYISWRFDFKNYGQYQEGLFKGEMALIEYSMDNGSVWWRLFTGFVAEEGMTRSFGALTDDHVSLTLFDRTRGKGTRRKLNNEVLINHSVSEIVQYLATKMGVTADVGSIDYVLPFIQLGNNTAWAELQLLQQAYNAEMYFTSEGKLYFHCKQESGYEESSSEWTFIADGSKIISGSNRSYVYDTVSAEIKQPECNRVKTTLDVVEVMPMGTVFRATDNWNETTQECYITIPPGGLYPSEGIAELELYNPTTGESYVYANVEQPTIGQNKTFDISYISGSVVIEHWENNTIQLRNNGAVAAIINKLELRGVPYLKTAEQIIEEIAPEVTDEVDFIDKEINGKYGANIEQISEVLAERVALGKYGHRVFSFETDFVPCIQRGGIVTLLLREEGLVKCKVLTYTHKTNGKTFNSLASSLVVEEIVEHTPTYNPNVITHKPGLALPSPGKDGQDGQDAKSFSISPASSHFTKKADGTYKETSISVVAKKSNIEGVVNWEISPSGRAASGDSIAVLASDFFVGYDWQVTNLVANSYSNWSSTANTDVPLNMNISEYYIENEWYYSRATYKYKTFESKPSYVRLIQHSQQENIVSEVINPIMEEEYLLSGTRKEIDALAATKKIAIKQSVSNGMVGYVKNVMVLHIPLGVIEYLANIDIITETQITQWCDENIPDLLAGESFGISPQYADTIQVTATSGNLTDTKIIGTVEDGSAGDPAPSINLSASGDSFAYTWIGSPINATQEITLTVKTVNLNSAITWTVPNGVTLTDVSSTIKRLSISNASSVKDLQSFTVSVSCEGYTDYVTIFNHVEAKPSKQYLGEVYLDPTENVPQISIRPKDSDNVVHFIEGDTVLYRDDTSKKYEVYRYTYNIETYSYSWLLSNASDDIFSAGTDLLEIADKDETATGTGIQFYKNLVAYNLKSANAEIDNLKVRLFEAEGLLGKVNIDEDGNLYGQDAAGRVRWRLNADGSGDIENLVTQLVEAKSIKADPLETEDAQPAVNPFSLNVPKTLFNYYDGINHILNSVVDKSKPTQINVAMIDGSLNYEQLVYQSGARELDSSTTITSWNSGDSLQFRHYKATGNVSAGNAGKECFKTLVNNTGRPVFVYASWNLGGTMNSLDGRLYHANSQNSADTYPLGNNNHDCWLWLNPGDSIGVQGKSWALWGSQSYECNFYFYKSDSRAFTTWLSRILTSTGYQTFNTRTYDRLITVYTLAGWNSTTEHVTSNGTLIYQIGESRTYFVEANKSFQYSARGGKQKITFIEHPVQSTTQGFYAKKTGAEWVKLDIAKKNTNNDYRTGNLSISSPISWSRTLTHVKSDDLIQAINAYSEKTTIITEQSSSQTYIKINGTTVSGNVLRVLKNSNEVKFEFTSGAITTIKKYGAYEGLYLSLESRIQPRNIDSSIKTKDILPKLASSYNIGSNENRYNTGYFLNLIVNSLSVAGSLAASKFLGLLSSSDVRNDNHPPSYYMSKGIGLVPEFKGCSVVGISNGGSYCQVVTQIIWSDGSGGYPMQIAYCQNGKIFRRYGTSNTAWSSWQSIVTEDVLSSYVTKLRADSFSTTEIYKNTTVKSYYGSTTNTKRITLGTSLVRGNVIVKIVANCKNNSLIPNNKIALYKNGARLAEQKVMATTDVTLTVNVTLVKGDILYIYTQNHSTSSNYTININSTTILADIDAGFAY